MSDRVSQLHSALQESQSKYTYFLLAATVAVIGFALRETSSKALDISQLPLAFAVFLWACSFLCGCLDLRYGSASLFANIALLQVEAGQHPDVRGYSQMEIRAASMGIRTAFESNSQKAARYAMWQFRLLILGALSYIAWHILNMYIRTAMPGYF